MKTVSLFSAIFLLIAAPAAAQNDDLMGDLDPSSIGVQQVEDVAVEGDDEGPLRGTVTDDSAWQDLGIAIASFATNRDEPTPANAQGTAALGHELARVVFSDLRFNGLFRPVGPDALPRPSYGEITDPAWPTWRGRSAEMLVHGYCLLYTSPSPRD